MRPVSDFPRLVAEWHPTRNGELQPEHVTAGSDKKIWWRCSVDAAHEWNGAVSMRTRGVGCPFCSGRRATATNNLAVTHPDVAREYDVAKNAPTPASEVAPFSSRAVWWKCAAGPDHQWQATVTARTAQRTRCPFCAGRRVSVTNSLAHVAPGIVAQWHPTKNGDLGPVAQSATAWQSRWWRCAAGPDHEWEDFVWSRVVQGAACPFCYGRRVSVTNSLASVAPDVARLWDDAKNASLTPEDVTSQSSQRAWWRCPAGPDHVWSSKVNNCVNGTVRCPYCAGKRISATNSLAVLFPALAAEWHPSKNGTMTPATVTAGANRRAWWRCAVGHEWSTRISHRTGAGSGCPTCSAQTRRGRRPLARRVVRERVRLPEP